MKKIRKKRIIEERQSDIDKKIFKIGKIGEKRIKIGQEDLI
jgi:hypothetical protein